MNSPTPGLPAPISLIGASIPRSGHHFLVRVLRRYYGKQIHYCEFYRRPDCCKQIPCTRIVGQRINYQKNHDHDLSLATNIPGVTYVIQHRQPVPEALSDRELLMKHRAEQGRPTTQTRWQHLRWLGRKVAYYKRFHDKWMVDPPPGAIMLDYDALTRDPVEQIGGMIARLDGSVDRARVADIVAKIRGERGKDGAYKPRVVQDSPGFDPELYATFESMVLDLCPGFGYPRLLEKVDYRRHPMYRYFRIRQAVRRAAGKLLRRR